MCMPGSLHKASHFSSDIYYFLLFEILKAPIVATSVNGTLDELAMEMEVSMCMVV